MQSSKELTLTCSATYLRITPVGAGKLIFEFLKEIEKNIFWGGILDTVSRKRENEISEGNFRP